MLRKMKEWLKRSKTISSIYFDLAMIKYFFDAKVNHIKSKRKLNKESIAQIKSYKDIHLGERCFIIGSGPSQNIHDLELLKDEYCFGVNTDFKIYDKTMWRPQYYVVMDDSMPIDEPSLFDGKISYEGFFHSAFLNYSGSDGIALPIDASNLFFLRTNLNKFFPRIFRIARFSENIARKVYCGKTVIYAAIQIAAYMGFKEIYLSGVDCNYTNIQNHTQGMEYASCETIDNRDIVQVGKLMIEQFDELSKLLDKRNISVYNATRGGMLDSFKRVNLEDIIK